VNFVVLLKLNPFRFGEIAEDGLYLPIDEDAQQTIGYGFIEYKEEESALSAIATMDKTPLDKKHTFRVYSWRSDLCSIFCFPECSNAKQGL
jgi:RNA recognition motif-containing protein